MTPGASGGGAEKQRVLAQSPGCLDLNGHTVPGVILLKAASPLQLGTRNAGETAKPQAVLMTVLQYPQKTLGGRRPSYKTQA